VAVYHSLYNRYCVLYGTVQHHRIGIFEPQIDARLSLREILSGFFQTYNTNDGNGRLAMADAIPWTNGGAGRLSVLLGLWYLSMLAAKDNNWV
jgi:hypothetical protein